MPRGRKQTKKSSKSSKKAPVKGRKLNKPEAKQVKGGGSWIHNHPIG